MAGTGAVGPVSGTARLPDGESGGVRHQLLGHRRPAAMRHPVDGSFLLSVVVVRRAPVPQQRGDVEFRHFPGCLNCECEHLCRIGPVGPHHPVPADLSVVVNPDVCTGFAGQQARKPPSTARALAHDKSLAARRHWIRGPCTRRVLHSISPFCATSQVRGHQRPGISWKTESYSRRAHAYSRSAGCGRQHGDPG
jgi:hypothetical protein